MKLGLGDLPNSLLSSSLILVMEADLSGSFLGFLSCSGGSSLGQLFGTAIPLLLNFLRNPSTRPRN